MLIYHRTSLLESTAQTVVNTVNCVGVMGKGIAADFRKRHPDMFKSYKKICDQKLLEPGKLWLWRGQDQWILNFPTKKHWRSPSKLEWIEQGLQKFVDQFEQRGIQEVAFPKLGCGNGNLEWDDVRPLMERYLEPLPIPVFIHDFQVNLGLPEHIESIIAESLHRPAPNTSDDLWNNIQYVCSSVGSEMVDLECREPFRADTRENTLLLETDYNRSFLDREELVDVWRILKSGMLTKRKLGFGDSKEASRLISVFSLLPKVRPIKIEYHNASSPEVAAEFLYDKISESSKEQLSLSWQ